MKRCLLNISINISIPIASSHNTRNYLFLHQYKSYRGVHHRVVDILCSTLPNATKPHVSITNNKQSPIADLAIPPFSHSDTNKTRTIKRTNIAKNSNHPSVSTTMQFLPLFCLSLLPLAALAHPFPLCNCGLGSGEDVCSNSNRKCTPLVVRPMDLPKPILPTPKVVCAPVGGVPPLIPIGGPCSCHTSLVKPAVVPKPQCSCGSCGRIDVSNDRQLTLSQKQQILFGGGCGGGAGAGGCGDKVIMTTAEARPILVDDVVEQGSNNPADYVPADPVSVAMAYKMAQESCNHNEDKLSFGFRSLPKDVPLYIKKRVNNIPEGDLYNLNGQIVELKKLKCNSGKSVDEEAAEELLALADEEEDAKYAATNNLMKRVTLGEIGYAPAKIKSPAFIDIPAAGAPLDAALTEGLKDCDDGFKPGHVVISQVPKIDTFSIPAPLPEPCADEGEPFLPPPPSIPAGAVFNSPYTYVSSSSSSSAMKNKFSQSVILQKLGGGGGCFN